MHRPHAAAGGWRRSAAVAISLLVPLAAAGCGGSGGGPAAASPPAAVPGGPRVVAVGTVQDGGLPHPGCTCRRCEAARRDPARRRHVASLAVVLPAGARVFPGAPPAGAPRLPVGARVFPGGRRSVPPAGARDFLPPPGGAPPAGAPPPPVGALPPAGVRVFPPPPPAGARVFLVDATPDVGDQLAALAPYRPRAPAGRVDRSPVDGVLLTHAHVGHYLGLAQFGFEVMHTQGVPVYCTPRMAAFLAANGPWDQLVRRDEIELRPTAPGSAIDLGEGVSATPLLVPHRDEYSDTVGFLFKGPRRSLLYVPDTDSWAAWERPLTEVLAGVDVAILDGTFYSPDELPGRDVTKIGHPLITTTMELLAGAVAAGRLEVYFTHLNHSNPALEPGSEALRDIEARGFHVLAEGQELPL
jgi:pyrroloquinoline quinone biosynthesis protein B